MTTKKVLIVFMFFMASIANASDIKELCLLVKEKQSRLPVETIEIIEQKLNQDIYTKTALEMACKNINLKYRLGPVYLYETEDPNLTFFFQKSPTKIVKNLGYIFSQQRFQLKQVEIKSNNIGLQTFALTPSGESNGTTILIRTPYFLEHGGNTLSRIINLVDVGYNVVIQPVRGSYLNDGEFDWLNWKEERDDAKVTIDWIVKNEWSNGKVILEGTSYPGFTALAGAASNHPAIIGVFAASAPTDKYMHGLSAGNSFIPIADYVTAVNSHGDTNLTNTYGHLRDLQKKYGNEILEKYEQIVGLNPLKGLREYAKIIQNDERPEGSKELFDELKKVSFPIVHSLGIHNDQDSLDSYQNYRQLEDYKNNFLFMHNNGHSEVVNNSLIFNFAQHEQSQESLEKSIKEFFKNENVCLNTSSISAYNSDQTICSSNYENFKESYQEELFGMLEGDERMILTEKEFEIVGPVELMITHRPLKKRSGMYLALYSVDSVSNQADYLTRIQAPLIPISETQSYVITNSIYHKTNNQNAIGYFIMDDLLNEIPKDQIEIESVKFILLRMKDPQ